MNYRNFNARKETSSKQNYFNKVSDKFLPRNSNNYFKRKTDFSSDDESENLKVQESNITNKYQVADSKNLNVKRNNDKMESILPKINNRFVNASDKYKLLETLDNFYSKKEKNLRLDRPIVSGTCQDMCPEKERYSRESGCSYSIFEKTGKDFDFRKAVKEYDRCVADQNESLPHNLRPTEVLQRTMNYLLTEIVDLYDENSSRGQWYTFLWNRTRSIKKDITQQNLCNKVIINIIEAIARFHIFCSAWLCERPNSEFDPKLNEDNLKNCMKTLKDMYGDMPVDSCGNESEFRSYMVLLNLDKGEVLDETQKLTSHVFNSPKLTFAFSVYQAIITNNYVRFFRLFEHSDLILSCLLHRFIVPMRSRAFEVFNKAFVTNRCNDSKLNQIPLSIISEQLKFDNLNEAREFCRSIHQEYISNPDNIIMVVLDYSKLELDTAIHKRISKLLVQSKRGNEKLSTIFNGGQTIPSSGLESLECKTVSFDENGNYIGTRPIPQNFTIPKKVNTEKPEEVICIDSSEEDSERLSPSTSIGDINTKTDLMDSNEEKRDNLEKNLFQNNSKNLFSNNQNSSSRGGLFCQNSKLSVFNNSQTTNTTPSNNLFARNFNVQPKSTEIEPQKLIFTIKNSSFQPPVSKVNTPELTSVVIKKPLISQEEINGFSTNVSDQLITEFIDRICKLETNIIVNNETWKDCESIKILDVIIKDLTREVIFEISQNQNNNKKIVGGLFSEDLILDIVHEEIKRIKEYVNKKKDNSNKQAFYQTKYYFKRWYRHSQDIVKSRKCLSKLPAAPRMADDFIVSENFRGKVRKISTDWFESKDVHWYKYPLTSRLERITNGNCKPITFSEIQNIGTQTIHSYHNKSIVTIHEFIKEFIKHRFFDVVDIHLGVLEMSSKVHPTPEIIVSDYNTVIKELQNIIQTQFTKPIDLSEYKLSVIPLSPNIQNADKEYIDQILTNLQILPNQKNHYWEMFADIFRESIDSQNLKNLSYFHIRLFPWINIIKEAILNKLAKTEKSLLNKEIEIENNIFSPHKLHLECIINEISVQHCINQCTKKPEQIIEHRNIKVPKRLQYFNELCNGIHKLQNKLEKFRENL